jgi:PIN domain nuclease of toxin-antitoxin system
VARRLLLDTHAFLWLAADGPLSGPAAAALVSEDSEVFLSLASVWEMAVKSSLGRLTLHLPLERLVREQARANSLQLLGIHIDHVLEVEHLPWVHRDPFDRLLVAQARREGLCLVSRDAVLDGYGIDRLW